MEENKLTPEQDQMRVYEDYIECFGEEEVIRTTIDAMDYAAKVFQVAAAMEAIEDSPIDDPAIQKWIQKNIAQVQVMLDMMEVIFGDTAYEASKLIYNLDAILREHGTE